MKSLSSLLHRHWWLTPSALYVYATVQVTLIALLTLPYLSPLELDNPIAGYSINFPQGNTWFDLASLWDGQWYREIVAHGYPFSYELSSELLSTWAFFPLYPLLLKLLSAVGIPFALAGIVVSVSACYGAVLVLFKLAYEHSQSVLSSSLFLLPLLASPAFFIMQSTYTEALALLLLAIFLSGLIRRNYVSSIVALLLLSLTRGLGVPLFALVLLYVLWHLWKKEKLSVSQWLLLPAAAISAGLWPLTVGLVLGDPLANLRMLSFWTYSERYPLWVPLLVGTAAYALHRLQRLPSLLMLWSVLYSVYITATTVMSAGLIRYALLSLIPLPYVFSRFSPRLQRFFTAMALVIVFLIAAVLQWLWFMQVWIITSPIHQRFGIP